MSAWRDFWGWPIFRAEIKPLGDEPFHVDATLRSLPDIALLSSFNAPLCLVRSPPMMADGVDSIGLVIGSEAYTVRQGGREVVVKPGHANALTCADASTWTAHSPGNFRSFLVKRTALEPLVVDLDDAVMRPISPQSDALRYLLGYVRFLEEYDGALDKPAAQSASRHLCDLLALALGAGRDATDLIHGRGLRAARLASIKRFIAKHFKEADLSVATVATHFNLTPRSLQRLFESDGTTFSSFLLARRLAHARLMLTEPRCNHMSIAAIALEAGFGDVSYFNRCFRSRFGEVPNRFRGSGPAT
jgi:AraC-like DNA-binding protein